MRFKWTLLIFLVSTLTRTSPTPSPPAGPKLYPRPRGEVAGSAYWMSLGRQEIAKAEATFANSGLPIEARNIILFIGDGMGMSTITAARILNGQLANKSGEEGYLSFEQFPHVGLSKTYNTDQQTPDSAGTATAYLSGVKTRSGLLGLSDAAIKGNCSSVAGAEKLPSFLRMAADAGRAVGIVTTTRLTHASPAAAYSHSADRQWEDDTTRNSAVKNSLLRPACPDIARQFVDNAADFRVVLAGGREKFRPKKIKPKSSAGTIGLKEGKNSVGNKRGSRSDGVNLIQEWKLAQASAGRRSAYVESAQQLADLSPNQVDSVLGLMADSNMKFHTENLQANKSQREPTLAEMTVKAIELLSTYGRSSGFVLFVEGGRIDHGHHENQANRALHDTVALSEAVQAAMQQLGRQTEELGNLNNTLMMVTADHSHVFAFGHYGLRGQPITELKYKYDSTGLVTDSASDDLPLTVVNYADGPGAKKSRRARWEDEEKAENFDTTAPNYRFPALIPGSSESHGGEDVPIYAMGPGAHLINGVHEQTHVAHVIMRAARLGPYAANASSMTTVTGGIANPSIKPSIV